MPARTALLMVVLPACCATISTGQDLGRAAPVTYEQPLPAINGAQAVPLDAAAPAATGIPNAPLPLRRPTPKSPAGSTPESAGGTMFKMFASLVAVIGLFVAVTWFLKRGTPGGMLNLPKEAFEVYGRAPLNPRQQVQLVRLGQRLLWVAVSANGVQTLTEVTDPVEFEQLSRTCRRDTGSAGGKSRGRIATALDRREPSTPRHLAGLYADDQLDIAESRHA